LAKRVDKRSIEKIVKDMIDVFRKHGLLSNILICYKDKLISFGSSEMIIPDNIEEEITFTEPKQKITEGKNPDNWGGNNKTLVVLYDGGPLYSCMTGEFGWDWKDRLEVDLQIVFGPYHLGMEQIDNISFTLYEGYVPDYELVIDKLMECK
jgi:hypothetical protein